MSLPAPYIEAYHVADGITTSFPFGTAFTAPSAANVKCIIYFEDGTNCVPTFTVDITTGYITIVTLTKPDGVVLTVPPAGSIVRVFRDTPEQQNVTASQLQNYTAKQLERIFDSVVAMIQETSYLARRKTIRLTETQRDVSVEQLTESKDQGIIYWDFETRQLKATDYGQDEVVKSETVDRLVYLQPEGKIYFIPKGTTTQIPVGSATIHNDLSGRNAPDCHPESAISNLTTHLQELRDADTAIDAKAGEALSKAEQAVETATEAHEFAEGALIESGEANTLSHQAVEYATNAQNAVANIHSERFVFTIEEGQTTLQFDRDIENSIVDLYYNGQLVTKEGNWTVSGDTISLLFTPDTGDIVFVIVGAITQTVTMGNLNAHNVNPLAHSNVISAHNDSLTAHTNLIAAHNADVNAHSNLITAHNADVNAHSILFNHIDCGTL